VSATVAGAPVWSNELDVAGTPPPPPVPGTLTVSRGANTPLSSIVAAGTSGFTVLQLALQAATSYVTVTGLSVAASGTVVDPTEAPAVYLVRDLDGDGVRDPGVEPLLAGPVAFAADDGKASFAGFSRTIAVGSPEHWLVVCDFDAGAQVGRTFRAGLAGAADVTATGGSPPPTVNVTPFDGNWMTVSSITGSALFLSLGVNQPGARSVYAGTSGLEFLHLRLQTGAAEAVVVQNLLLSARGTLMDPAPSVTLNLWRDANGDNWWSAGDELLQGPVQFLAGSRNALVWNLDRTIPAGTTETWIVTVDFGASTPDYTNLAALVASPDSVSAAGATTGSKIVPLGTPVEGSEITVFAVPGGGGGGETTHVGGSCAASADGAGGPLAAALLVFAAAAFFRAAGARARRKA
jgi:hypothetical protein